ncbi:hypothetical protein BC941DRAFT_436248 [Chlamydoabsidia padenii]|nr:hypothetical protein BC941DRAFT_436248 [Chlamydoabsidia padenii]
MSTLCQLPMVILELILNNINTPRSVNQMALLNKRFYNMLNPRLWGTPMICYHHSKNYHLVNSSKLLQSLIWCRQHPSSLHPVPLNDVIQYLAFSESDLVDTVALILSHTRMLKKLKINEVTNFNDEVMQYVTFFCARLEYISLEKINVTALSLQFIAKLCPRILGVEIHHCATINTLEPITILPLKRLVLDRWPLTISPATAPQLARFTKLLELELILPPDATNDFLKRLLQHRRKGRRSVFRQLTHFTLNGKGEVPFVYDDDFSDRDSYDSYDNYHGSGGGREYYDDDDSNEKEREERDPHPSISHIDHTSLVPFFKAHPKLQSITLLHCRPNMDILLPVIATPHLESLCLGENVGNLSKDTLKQLIMTAPNLKRIELDSCYHLGRYYGGNRLDATKIEAIRNGTFTSLPPTPPIVYHSTTGFFSFGPPPVRPL